MTVGVVGLGLIGGSLALSLRDRGHALIGCDRSERHEAEAVARGLVDECDDIRGLAGRCDLIAVAVPVDAAIDICRRLLDLESTAAVVELGSTKAVLAKALREHPQRGRLVLSHPMAGTEFSGPTAAVSELYAGKVVVFCDREDSATEHFALVSDCFERLGMRVVEMASGPHDVHVAYVSHISHVSSFALSLTVLAKERDGEKIFQLAAGGFASTVRLAKSNPNTWAPILAQNAQPITDVLDEYIAAIQAFREALAASNQTQIHQLITQANAIAAVLPPTR